MDSTSEAIDLALSETQNQGVAQAMDNDALDEAFEVTEVTIEDADEHNDEPSASDDPIV